MISAITKKLLFCLSSNLPPRMFAVCFNIRINLVLRPGFLQQLLELRDVMDPLHWLYFCRKSAEPPPPPPLLEVNYIQDCLD